MEEHKMILISAGHHPYRKGASFEGFYEHDEAMFWAVAIVNGLGSKAMLVPPGLLKNKVAFINDREVELAIEIHFNSAKDINGNRVGKGSETLYYPGNEKGRRAALTMQARLAPIFAPDRGAKEGWYQMNKDKGPDYFLAKTNCTALIVEPEFIHHKDFIVANRQKGCDVIVQSLTEILETSI